MLNPEGNPQREKRDGHNMLLLNFEFKKSDILRNTKIIKPPKLAVIASYFGRNIARIAIADNIVSYNFAKNGLRPLRPSRLIT